MAFVQDLSEILEMNKVFSRDESKAMQKAFEASEKEQFDDFLLEEGLVEEGDLLKALSQYYQVPSFDVLGYFFDHNLITKFPRDFLLREAIIPLEVDENILSVVVSEPDKDGLESMIREYVSYDIVLMVGLRRDICDAVKEFYDSPPSQIEEYEDIKEEKQIEVEVEEIEDSGQPVIKEELE
ncbi:hypothetical protein ACFLYU_02430 [Candidatus Dependentiae bacterium]